MTPEAPQAGWQRGIIVALLLVAFAEMSVATPSAADSTAQVAIDDQIDRMSTDERIAQLMIVGIPTYTPGADLEHILAGWRFGGAVLYAGNLGSTTQVRRLTTAIRRAAGPIPPFIAVDQEGGIVRRVQHGATIVPSNMALGATGSVDLARRAGLAVGASLRNLGFTMNFAPVLDVLPDLGPAALQTRAFSNQPGVVADLGVAFIQGQRAGGIIPVGKHFPGLGRTVEDSHRVLPILNVTHEDLRARDLVPFRRAIEAGLSAIMTGHVALPGITGKTDLAATLSSEVVTNILRKELRFEGLVVSDALEMKAFSQPELIGETALQAVIAGCDMLLVAGRPRHRTEVFNGLRRGYRDGTLTEARLRESLRRILAVKAVRLDEATRDANDSDVEREIARRAVTVIGDREILATALRETPVYVGPPGELERVVRTSHAIILPSRITDDVRSQLRDETMRALAKTRAWIAVARTDDHWEFIAQLSTSFRDLPMVYVNLGSPYRTIEVPRIVSVLTYSSSLESQRAAVKVLNGVTVATGVLPVTLAPPAASRAEP